MTNDLMPAMYDHILRVYAAMEAGSKEEGEVENGDYTGKVIRVYEGHLTGLFQELGISAPYYTKIMSALKRMNCAVQLRRGGGSATSKWQLLQSPTPEGYTAWEQSIGKRRKDGPVAALEQRLRSAEKRLETIEKYLEESTA